MKVIVDRDRCEANGVCVLCCAQMFHVGDDDTLTVLMAEIPERLLSAVEDAVRRCPRQSLRIER